MWAEQVDGPAGPILTDSASHCQAGARPKRQKRSSRSAVLSDICDAFAVSDVLPGSFVSTERLGLPRGIVARLLGRAGRVAELAGEPTATCHLQLKDDDNALCGYEWEGLSRVPGDPGWKDLHPDLRCDACSAAVNVPDGDPDGRDYRHSW